MEEEEEEGNGTKPRREYDFMARAKTVGCEKIIKVQI